MMLMYVKCCNTLKLALFADLSSDYHDASAFRLLSFFPTGLLLMVYLPLKLENSWYPVLSESTDRNELASGVGRCELFPARFFFPCPSFYFPVLHPLLLGALLVTPLVPLLRSLIPLPIRRLVRGGENRRLSTSNREIPTTDPRHSRL